MKEESSSVENPNLNNKAVKTLASPGILANILEYLPSHNLEENGIVSDINSNFFSLAQSSKKLSQVSELSKSRISKIFLKKKKQIVIDYIEKTYPKNIVDYLGLDFMASIPFYQKEVPIGFTGYLDQRMDMGEIPLFQGKDKYGRAFLAVNYTGQNKGAKSKKYKYGQDRLFKRYTNQDIWRVGREKEYEVCRPMTGELFNETKIEQESEKDLVCYLLKLIKEGTLPGMLFSLETGVRFAKPGEDGYVYGPKLLK